MSLSMLSASMLTLIESSLNTLLKRSPDTLSALAKLEGKVIEVESVLPAFQIYLLPHAGGFDIHSSCGSEPDAKISGTAAKLAKLPIASNEVLFGNGVTLSGDSHLVTELQTILTEAPIDWEAWLASVMGDTLGHEAARFLRNLGDYGRKCSQNLSRDTTEYLQEELRLLPSRIEIELFMNDVDTLRDDVARIETRIQALKV